MHLQAAHSVVSEPRERGSLRARAAAGAVSAVSAVSGAGGTGYLCGRESEGEGMAMTGGKRGDERSTQHRR